MIVGKVVHRFQTEDFGEVLIRYPKMSDAEDLLNYFNSVIDEEVITYTGEKDMDWQIERLTNMLKDIERGESVALVVEVEGKVMGEGEISKNSGALSHTGELGCGLRKEIRGRGIGTKLVKALFREARERLDLEIIELKVYSTNEPAQNLYKKVGFDVVGVIEDGACHNGNYKDVIIMEKDLRTEN